MASLSAPTLHLMMGADLYLLKVDEAMGTPCAQQTIPDIC